MKGWGLLDNYAMMDVAEAGRITGRRGVDEGQEVLGGLLAVDLGHGGVPCVLVAKTVV